MLLNESLAASGTRGAFHRQLVRNVVERGRVSWNIKLSPLQWLTVLSDVRMRTRLTIQGAVLVLNVPLGAAVTGSPGN
jgi:hypothetical protein